MAADKGEVKLEKFDGKDFGFWKMQIGDYLYQKKLYQPLEEKKPEGMQEAEWKLLDRQALGVIRLTLSRNVAFNIAKETTTAGLMKALSNMYEKPSASNKVHLMRRLFSLRMSEGGSVAQHLNELNSVTTQLSSVEITFDDEVLALILLSSLPDSWNATVTAVSSSSGSNKLKFDDVRDLVLSEEIRRRESGESASSSVLHTELRGRPLIRRNERGRSNYRGQSRDRRSKSRNPNNFQNSKTIECWNCGKIGHYKNQCKGAPKGKEVKAEANVTSTGEGDDALICSLESKEESWVLDSGASFHATSNKNFFEKYVNRNLGQVYLGDDQPCDIVGQGNVKIKLNGSAWELKDVKHVPDLRKNLIFVGQLAREGYTIIFQGDNWKISKGSMTVAHGKKNGTLYLTAGACYSIAVATENENSKLWHQRLGHMSEKGMKILHSIGKLPCLKFVNLDMCEECILGKQKRVSFQTYGRTPMKEKLELVHSDVWGPTTTQSIGGKQYFVTFIDDHSRKVWVYFLKYKSEVFEAFRIWKARVENETGLKIKRLRSDNGGEYEDTKFKRFCYEHGIKMERTVPGTPQHNGIAERMNRTLTERARSIRIQSGLPKQFWAEAVNTATYLINRGPSTPLEYKLPEEVWSGKEIKLSHLKVFGCVAYVHISDQGRNKLDPKSKVCTFIGYGEDEFGYRIWDDESKKIIRSRDVIFNERVMYKDRHKIESYDTNQKESTFIDEDYVPDNTMQEYTIISTPQQEEQTVQGCTSQSNDIQQPSCPTPTLRRSTRPHVPNRKYMNYLLLTDDGEPEDYYEASQTRDASKWELAMKDEMQSLISNQTWELTELPIRKKALHNKWIYRVKKEHDDSKRYKARLVVKGFQQKEGVDYNEIFAPVVKLNTIRTVLSIVAIEDLYLEQLDVKTAFLHGDLDEEIYMHQPEGFIESGKEKMVCKLKKSLYGLKQAPRQWYKKFDNFMHNEDFQKCNADHCCYFKRYQSSYIILLLYVDDMLIAGSHMNEIIKLKHQLSREFDMKDLGPAKKILGMQITRDKQSDTLQLSQSEYIKRVLQRFNMGDAKPVSTPLASHFRLSKDQSPQIEEDKEYMAKVPYASAIGSLMYAMVCTRPDIGHAVGVVSRYMSNPGKVHWEAVKWILRYLRGTINKCLYFGKGELKIQGYVDADFGGEVDNRKSTTGYVFTVGNTAVSWMSQLQKIVALSTTEAEYVAVTEASKEMIWLQGLLDELGFKQENNILYSDSQSAIHLAKNSALHSRTKHIGVRYHFIRSLLEDEVLNLRKILGSKNPADMLTKTVTIDKLKLCATSIGLKMTED
ncbi:unnamed protein product [Amaranthus hypochondriacus]